ncbi:MAG: hypothetical protein ACXWUG_22850 [Polyangiales bacterium]
MILLVFGLAACAAPQKANPWMSPAQIAEGMSPGEVRNGGRAPRETYRQTIVISIREEVSGRGFEGRGVVAVMPGHALRMVLLGPGGTTAMDCWIRDGRWRVAIPGLDRIVRGDRSTPRSTMRGLPIDLLERWLIAPWGGTIVAAHPGHVRADGSIAGEDGIVAWMLRNAGSEVREEAATSARAWFFDHGKLVGRVTGTQRETPQGRFVEKVQYEGLDPAMKVAVTADPPAFGALPASTFEDPN